MDSRTVDPRLEADLADLLGKEARPHWLARASAFAAIPAAVALLAALAAVPLLTPAAAPPVVLAAVEPDPPAVEAEPAPPAPTPTPTPAPAPVATADPALVGVAVPDWIGEALGLASAFAVDYLGWSQFPEASRASVLSRYLAPGVDPAAGWRVAGQLVAATPIVTGTTQESRDRVTVTVAVRITGLEAARWVHLAVPIGRDAADQIAVADLPRLVPAPSPGAPSGPAGETDPELLEDVRAVGEDAARAHLTSLSSGTGFEATETHLVEVFPDGNDTAVGRVEVLLTDTVTSAQLTQALWIDLGQRDGAWEVTGIR